MIFNLCFLDMRTRPFKAILIQRQKGNICELFICYWSLFQTQLDILGRVGTIVNLLLLNKSLPEVLGVFELPVGIRTFEVKPKQLKLLNRYQFNIAVHLGDIILNGFLLETGQEVPPQETTFDSALDGSYSFWFGGAYLTSMFIIYYHSLSKQQINYLYWYCVIFFS